jgi:hypothetical protein
MANFRFPEQIATSNDDFILATTRQTTFALEGNDTIQVSAFSEYSFVAGGTGNDTYISINDSAVTIIDSGGFDKLIVSDILLNNPNIYMATVGGQHFLAMNSVTHQQISIANWLTEQNRIEEIQFIDGVYSYSQVAEIMAKSPNFLGDLKVEDLVSMGKLPAGTTSDDLSEFFNYVIAREAQLSGTATAPTTAVTVIPIAAVISTEPFFVPPQPVFKIAGLDDGFYLTTYPDVAASGMDPDLHFATFGWKEGRDPNAWFDTDWYLTQNSDVAAAGLNPLEHYWQYGWQEGRNPSATFNTNAYLSANSDVALVGVNPLEHWLSYGQLEGRPLD